VMYQRSVHDRKSRYQSSIAQIDKCMDTFRPKETEADIQRQLTLEKVNAAKALVYDLSQSSEQWMSAFLSLYKLDVDVAQECVGDFCSSFAESGVYSLRCACERIAQCREVDFLSRCKCLDTLRDIDFTCRVLKMVHDDPTDDINYTVFADQLINCLYADDCVKQYSNDIEQMATALFINQCVNWSTKYGVWVVLVRANNMSSKIKMGCGQQLLQRNKLTSYTVLTLQLFSFDDKTLKSICNRCKALTDLKVKADVLDHLLTYPSTANDANEMLKELGEGMRTLDSSQNVHMVSADVNAWLLTLTSVQVGSHTLGEVIAELTVRYDSPEVATSLRRIELDNSLYGNVHYRLAGVLLRLYVKILSHPNCDELFKRLGQELTEMCETCSTGHLLRLMNVFSGYDDTRYITVDPKIELKSVLNKRIDAYVQSLKHVYDEDFLIIRGVQSMTLRQTCTSDYLAEVDTINESWEKEQKQNQANKQCAQEGEEKQPLPTVVEETQTDEEETCDVLLSTASTAHHKSMSIYDKVLEAWMEGNEAVLQRYVYSKLPDFYQELYNEYVGQNIMTDSDFEEAYRDITINYLFSF